MAILNIDQIEPGMILGSEVRDIYGRLLCKPDVKITEKHLITFRTWGITEADIINIDEDVITKSDEMLSPELVRKAEGELREIFRNADISNPVISELFNLCVLRKAGNES